MEIKQCREKIPEEAKTSINKEVKVISNNFKSMGFK